MLSVKIEFCRLDWYSSSPTAIVLHNRMYMCKVFSSNSQKLKKRKCNLHEVSSASSQAYRRLANDIICFSRKANKLVKFISLNKGV